MKRTQAGVLIPDGISQRGVATGSVAQRLMQSGFKVNSLRTNDVLQKEEWLQFDQKVVDVSRQRLVGVADLLSAGLRFDVGNALGTTILQWQQVSDMNPAEVSMSGITPGQGDRADFATKAIPLPIIHKDFNINIRVLEASRRMGETLDTTQSGLCAKLVAEKTEEILFKGSTIVGGGGTLYGYTTAPNRNTGSIGDWSSLTGTTIISELLTILAALRADHHFGPYALYVPQNVYTHLQDDFKTNSDRTILERILAIPEIKSVKVSENLAGGATPEVVVVELQSDVVDMVVGMQPTIVQWDTMGGMVSNFKVMSIMVPRIKDDSASQSGIAHYT